MDGAAVLAPGFAAGLAADLDACLPAAFLPFCGTASATTALNEVKRTSPAPKSAAALRADPLFAGVNGLSIACSFRTMISSLIVEYAVYLPERDPVGPARTKEFIGRRANNLPSLTANIGSTKDSPVHIGGSCAPKVTAIPRLSDRRSPR